MIERLWSFVSIVLLAFAAIFLWRNNLSAAFVTATLGAVAWFLSYRARLRVTFGDGASDANEEESNDADHQE
jgi:hypothetical protein